MNVYDFDHTIYRGDSTADFYFFCLRRHPMILSCIPKQVSGAARYKMGKITKTQFKEQFYSFFPLIHPIEQEIQAFWDAHEKKIGDWYRKQQKEDDCVISASPEILLSEICARLGNHYLIASVVDRNGRYQGENCRGEEKVKRFYKEFPDGVIHQFYSDSASDRYLAEIAEQSFLVKRGIIRPWTDNTNAD